MTTEQPAWTEHITAEDCAHEAVILERLCTAFNASPYFAHSRMQMRVADGQIEAYVEMQPELVGNTSFQILHGGATATILDSIGGITAMAELYKQCPAENFAETARKVTRLATLDLRVDYIAPGRGRFFTARAQVLRLGRKSCLVRMEMHNDAGKLIAVGIATYSY